VEGAASIWHFVLTGIPQGSAMGPLLLLNDLDLQIINTAVKFDDDTKVFGSVSNEHDRVVLQNDPHRLSNWADIWQM